MLLCHHADMYRPAVEHVNVFCHMFRKRETVFEVSYLGYRLAPLVQHAHICHAVNAEMRYIIILIIVANQVITPVVSYNLVRIYDIQFFPLGMQLKVRSVGIINEADLLFPLPVIL